MVKNASKKTIGLVSATALGISSIIGSGWLFAPYQASVIAGPASLISWVIAAIIISILGLAFSEIASLYPRRGLSAIIPTLSHNKHFAFPFAIANWLGIVAVIALEADATTEYLINLAPTLKPLLYQHGELTLTGDLFAIFLVLGFSTMNWWGASTLVKANNLFAALKVIIPVFIGIAILLSAFHPANFTSVHNSFVPYGPSSVLSAILTTGIIVAFNGFQTVISFSSEIKKPCRTIPLSVCIAIFFCLAIYLVLEVAFIGAIPEKLLATGWRSLGFNAPVLQLLSLIGLGFLSMFAYFGATVAPIGSGITFAGTSSRMFTAMSRNEQMPAYFKLMHPQYAISRRSLVLNTVIAVLFLLVFRSWNRLAEVLSLFHVISYLPVPIALCVLRGKISKRKYLFRLPFGRIVAYALFIFFTYLFTLAEMSVVNELMTIFAFCLAIFILVTSRSISDFKNVLGQIWALLIYFAALYGLTYVSPLHATYFNDIEFVGVVAVIGTLLFICLLKSARNDVEIIDASVRIYQ